MKDLLRVLTTPSCWFQNHRYERVWDKKLNELMREHKFTEIREHTAKLGDVTVWIANHPYASFTVYNPFVACRPKRITILKAFDRLFADRFASPPAAEEKG